MTETTKEEDFGDVKTTNEFAEDLFSKYETFEEDC